jgi:hypothetical protein
MRRALTRPGRDAASRGRVDGTPPALNELTGLERMLRSARDGACGHSRRNARQARCSSWSRAIVSGDEDAGSEEFPRPTRRKPVKLIEA